MTGTSPRVQLTPGTHPCPTQSRAWQQLWARLLTPQTMKAPGQHPEAFEQLNGADGATVLELSDGITQPTPE
jgi:hypothetical protein